MRPLAVLLLLALAGCGYSVGQVSSGRGQTLAVPMFENTTLRRDLERDLTRFVREEIAARTSYALVDSGADLTLSGRLTDVEEDVLSDRSKGRIRESSVAFTVVIDLRDEATGKAVLDSERIVERAAFVPVKGESIRTAEILVMRRIAERVVYSLSGRW